MMVLEEIFVNLLLDKVNSPIFSVEIQQYRSAMRRIKVKMLRYSVSEVILCARIWQKRCKWLQNQMVEAVHRCVVEELVLKPFLAVFLSGVNLHAFCRLATRTVPVSSKTALLIYAAVICRLVKLNVGPTFPFNAVLIVVAGLIGINGIKKCPLYKDASVVVEQIKGVSAN